MALSVIRGKSYTIDGGLDSQDSLWFVAGKVSIPLRIDETLGWMEPGLNRPGFVSCDSLMCVECDILGNILSEDCHFVPLFAVTDVISMSDETVPLVINAPSFISEYEISSDFNDWYIQDINSTLVRVDDSISWRKPLSGEEPVFVNADTGVCMSAIGPPWSYIGTSPAIVPLFLTSKVYTWTSIGGSGITFSIGPQGPQGPQGNDGYGFQGNMGPQGQFGNSGSQGPQGPQPTGSTHSISFTINSLANPVNSSYPVWRSPYAITVTAVHVLCIGGTGVEGNLWIYDTNGAYGYSVDTSDITASAGINIDDISLSNPYVASGYYVGWHMTSISGLPTSVLVSFDYILT